MAKTREEIIADIREVIKQNNQGDITGEILQQILVEMTQNIAMDVQGFTYQIVNELPVASAVTMYIIFLVHIVDPSREGEQNNYEEYITIKNNYGQYEWEKLGDLTIDLNDYYTKQEVDDKINQEIATILEKPCMDITSQDITNWNTTCHWRGE